MSIIRKRVILPSAFLPELLSVTFRMNFAVRYAMPGRIIINRWDKAEGREHGVCCSLAVGFNRRG
jgi:hypothetical protein